MLCENKIPPQFNFGTNTYCSFHFRAAIFESRVCLTRSRFQFEGRALYTLATQPTTLPLAERAEFTTQQMLSN